MILFFSLSAAESQTSFSPSKEALRLVNNYKPTIERNNNAIVDEPTVICGDINNDSLEDCIIFFVMTNRAGGNAIIGQEAAIYINKGKKMKVVGAFPKFDFCYSIDKIKDQIINLKEYKCEPPYNEFVRERKVIYRNGVIVGK